MRKIALRALLALSFLIPVARADVILEAQDANAAIPGSEPAPRERRLQVHDLVTVKIKDFVNFRSRMELLTERNTTLDINFEEFFNVARRRGDDARRSEEGNYAVEHATDGRGDERRRTDFEATITVEVIAIRENGTLVVEGRQEKQFDQTRVTMTLTGICRHEDITPRNEVASDRIFDLRTHLESRGPTPDAARQGWFVRFLNRIWPF
ncbi:MAG: flagellar basal body L-ring protein FlgH [Planctomycetes bacterium]|nr:flagellar basal body L-ring protein FlgH [Planctomycetota bacterium]